MNRPSILTTAIACALSVIIAVGGTLLVGSLVLCVGSDGHVDVEVALDLCCLTESPQPGGSNRDREAALVDSCGSCADLELDATPRTREKHRLQPPVVTEMATAIDLRDLPKPVGDHRGRDNARASHLDVLAAVVFLI